MTEETRTKVCIGLPSGGTVRTETAACLVYLTAHKQNIIFDLMTPMSCYIHENRERIVERALFMDAEYVFFIDGDMVFPESSLKVMISREKDIIGAAYNYRDFPPRSTVKPDIKYTEDYEIRETPDPRHVTVILKDPSRPYRCRAVGTGLMLIRTSVFKKIPRPWFHFQPNIPGVSEFVGEDVFFCDKAREHGYEIWVEPTLQVGHIGAMVF